MSILVMLASIAVLTSATVLVNKSRLLPVRVCAICAGVSATWLWMLIGLRVGLLSAALYQLIIATMMGGSVVGIAYVLEDRLRSGRSPFLWKALFIPVGFIFVNAVVTFQWAMVAFGGIAELCIVAAFFIPTSGNARPTHGHEAALEKKMKNCC